MKFFTEHSQYCRRSVQKIELCILQKSDKTDQKLCKSWNKKKKNEKVNTNKQKENRITMYLRIEAKLSLIVLTIVDLCSSIPNFGEQIKQSDKNGITIIPNKDNKFNLNRKHDAIAMNIYSDNESDEQRIIHQNNQYTSVDETSSSQSDDYVDDSDHMNFIITNYLSDGEIERRIHFNGITAKETLVSNSGYVISSLLQIALDL